MGRPIYAENMRTEQPEQHVDQDDAGHTTAAHVSSRNDSSSTLTNTIQYLRSVAKSQRLKQRTRYLQRQTELYSEAMHYRTAHLQQLRDAVAALEQQLANK